MSCSNPIMGEFEACVGPHRREMVRLARKMTKSEAAADDVVQEALVRAWSSWPTWAPKFREGAEVTPESTSRVLRAWLIRITYNEFARLYARHASEMSHFGISDDSAITAIDVWDASVGQPPPTPAEAVVDSGLGDEVTEALDAILPERRDLVLLSATGLTVNEIAAVAKVPVGTVFSRICRGRADLATRLSEFAVREYRIGTTSGRARVDAPRDEAPKSMKPNSDCVDDVVRGDDHRAALDL